MSVSAASAVIFTAASKRPLFAAVQDVLQKNENICCKTQAVGYYVHMRGIEPAATN